MRPSSWQRGLYTMAVEVDLDAVRINLLHATAVQQRFGFTLHQLREGCRAVCSPAEPAGSKLVPGSGVTVQQLAEALQQAGLLQTSRV